MDDARHLRIYLSERLAIVHGARRLAERMRSTAERDPGLDAVLADAGSVLGRDAALMAAFLRQLGSGPPRLRMLAAAAGERIGRLTPNGRVTGRSPLSDLQELDGLVTLLEAAAAGWASLEEADVAAPDLVRGRSDALRELSGRLEGFRPARAARALAGSA